MNPIQAWINSIIRNKRRCPKCKRDQIVFAITVKAPVCCKFCGANIPLR